MVQFFRTNDPFRILGLIFLFGLCRLPLFMYKIPLSIQELNWMILGEKLSKGFLLYQDIWENTAPLSALTYSLMHISFGKSQLAYQIVALIIAFGQAIFFNYICRKNELYNEKSFLPGAIYLILMNLFFDFFTLSPVLLASTCLLFAIDNVLYHIKQETTDTGIFNTGFYISLASLFYLPCLSFILFPIFAFLLFSRTSFRQYFVLLIGYSFPTGITLLYFYWYDAQTAFMSNFVFSYIYLQAESIYSAPVFMVILIAPLTLVGMAIMSLIGSNKHINYQVICQQLMFFWILLALAIFTFSEKKGAYQLIPVVPAMAFFIIHYLIATKKKFIKEIAFWSLSISTLYVTYDSLYGGILEHTIINTDETFVKNYQYDHLIKNSKIVVLGHNHSIFRYNSLSTPYLNWGLSEKHFGNLDSYNNVVGIYENFKNDLPDYIIDDEEIISKVFDRIPQLQATYELSNYENVYIRKGLNKY